MLARLDSVLVLLCMIIAASLVQSAHISSNITRTDADFDGADREYSYDSAPIEAEESYAQRMCSRSRNAYVENRMDCNRFFVCAQDDDQPPSKPLVGVCPPGMWFDPYHSDDEVLCVFPEVLCATDHTDAYSYCNCSATFAAHAGSDADQDALIESSTECIVDNQLHLYESKRDCERYFACYNEKVFRMQCKPGMHFNVRKGYCDTPEATDCEVLDPECPPIGITFLPHPWKCDMFYYCVFGQKILQSCDFYHVWRPDQQQCVRKDTYDCRLED